jgi:hypothetical protein
LPQDAAAGGTCDLGGFPPKTVKITTVAQVQLAVNFARNTGVRLIVHNTGHDYLGKSIGAGGLSIWTNNLKSIDFIPGYNSASSSYAGPAMRLGAGVEVYELYEAANKYGVSAIGGECSVRNYGWEIESNGMLTHHRQSVLLVAMLPVADTPLCRPSTASQQTTSSA